jgi:hypothetical protein
LSGFRIAYLTRAINRCIKATVYRSTSIGCAQISIVTVKGCTRLTAVYRITCFKTIAYIIIVAGKIVRCVPTGIANLVTGIYGTGYTVITIRWCAVLATIYRITGL